MLKSAFMRTLLLLFLFIFVSKAGCQVTDSAYIVIPVNSHNFGKIQEDKGIVSHTFSFKNSGSIPLLITHIRTTCGCTTPDWTRNPVMPGGEGTITLNFDPSDRQGAFYKTIQVQSNATNANMFLTISGTVVPPVNKEELHYRTGDLALQNNYINFGYLFKGNIGNESLIIANFGHKQIEIGFDSLPEYLRIEVVPSVLKPGEFGQVEAHYNTNLTNDWDIIIDRVPLIIDGTYDKNVFFTFTANVREDFSRLTPEQMAIAPVADYGVLNHLFDTLRSDEPVHCRFPIRNEGQSDLIIRAVKPSCGCTAVKPGNSVLKPGDSTYIDAVFYPKGRTGDFKNGITVVTNDPKTYKQYLWLEGFIRR
jgi:hypothetical protein